MTPTLAGSPTAGRPVASFPWATVAWVSILLLVCYASILMALVRQWNGDPDMGHGFFVPVIAGFIAWQKRERIAAA